MSIVSTERKAKNNTAVASAAVKIAQIIVTRDIIYTNLPHDLHSIIIASCT